MGEDDMIKDKVKNIILLDSYPMQNCLYWLEKVRKRYLNCTFIRLKTSFKIPKDSLSMHNYNVVSLIGTPHSWGGFAEYECRCRKAATNHFLIKDNYCLLPENTNNIFERDVNYGVRTGILLIDWVDRKILINPRDQYKRATGLITKEKELVKDIIESYIPEFSVEVKAYNFSWIPQELS